jgi:hypothetical protein
MFSVPLSVCWALNVPDRTGVFFRSGEVSHANTTRKIFGAYFPIATTFDAPRSDISRVLFPRECQSVIVSSRLSDGLAVKPGRGITDVCVWYVLNYARLTVTARPTVSITSSVLNGEIIDLGNLSVPTNIDVESDVLLRFTFSAPDPVALSVSPLDGRDPLPPLRTRFEIDSSVHFFVNEARDPSASASPARPMSSAECELLGSMFTTGVGIAIVSICWCCIGACCYRIAKWRNARRQQQALERNELEAIPPVLPGQYQPIAPPYGYPVHPQQPAQAQYPQAQQPAQGQCSAPQYPRQQPTQPQSPQQPQYQPQGGRGPGIVYGH